MVEFHFSGPEESPGYLLWQVTMLWQRKMKRALDLLGITHTQFVLLAALGWLSKDGAVVTQVELANHSKTDRMMVSKVLRTLESKGLINRSAHETDTRAKSIGLTSRGVEMLRVAIKVVEQSDIEFFGSLEQDLPHFLQKMADLMKGNADH
ncbi:MAG: MarR family transcriptional regulator [Saprospiraceae bacterium]|nr:MarR family transcriptional regulator [Saprospiraceae bacterium]MCB9324544.1 MarR family transcriptional regulator [Lewinellaceae bacterium]